MYVVPETELVFVEGVTTAVKKIRLLDILYSAPENVGVPEIVRPVKAGVHAVPASPPNT